MATHYVSSSIQPIKMYNNTVPTSHVVETLLQNSQVTVLDEFVGFNCNYHYVSSSVKTGYILSEYIFPLEGTAPSAPHVSTPPNYNYAFIEPEWHMLTEYQPYINEKTREYCICITNNSLNLGNSDENQVLKQGIKALFKFYNKPSDDETISKYMQYYIFAKINDYYVPFRPFMRTKYLVSIPTKYFDAIEDDMTSIYITPLNRDISKVDFVLDLDLKEVKQRFSSLESIIDLYNTDITFSNTTLVFSTSNLITSALVNQTSDILQNDVVSEMNFDEKKQNIIKFQQALDNLLTINNLQPELSKTSAQDIRIQFAINSECNIIYDVAIKINGICTNLRKGIETFLQSEAVCDPTTVNFIKYIYNINQIEKCKVPWYDFAEKYVFPSIKVVAPTLEDNVSSYEQFKKLYNLFLSFQKQNSVNPSKTYDEILQEQKQSLQFQLNEYFSLQSSPFLRMVYQADNLLDISNLDKTLSNLEISISDGQPIGGDKYAILKGDSYYLVSKGSDNLWTSSSVSTESYKINNDPPSVTVDSMNYTLYKSTKEEQAKKVANDAIEAIRKQLHKIYDFINKIGICKLTDLVFSCQLVLLRSFGVDVDASLTLGTISNFKYDKIINEIIPYLPIDQQQFIYEQLLLSLGCVNSTSLLYTLKRFLSTEEYTTLNLESASYEEIIKEVASKMVTTIVSA